MKSNYEIQNVTWDQIEKLSSKILDQINDLDEKIDTLVPVFRGGTPLAMLLAANMENVSTACIHIKRSKDNVPNSEFGLPVHKGTTNITSITGKNILLVEDIIDNGETLDLAVKEAEKLKPNKIYIATLFNFNKTKYSNVISGEKMENHCWIVFPWERKLKDGE